MTPGQAAYEAYAMAMPDDFEFAEPDALPDYERDAWEAAARAAIEASDIADDFQFERKQVVELRQVLTEVFTCLNTADMSLLDADQVDEWRERAGLDEP